MILTNERVTTPAIRKSLLRVLREQGPMSAKQAYRAVADDLNISDGLFHSVYPVGIKDKVYYRYWCHRVRSVKQGCVDCGKVANSVRNVWELVK